ncbi:MAG: hypothetical protein K6A42_10295 [Treponema sp.]|nr:hypothetical protein [Treponema sp.]
MVLLFIPLLFFNAKEKIDISENRTLSAKPLLIKDGRFNGKFFADFDSYFKDRFGGRDVLIKVVNAVNSVDRRRTEMALEGNDGWLYFLGDNNVEDFFKTNLLSDKEIKNIKNEINEITNWCEQNGIQCLFVICPNKHSIYPEHYPYPRPVGKTRADQMCQIFSDLEAPFVFSRDYLISQKEKNPYPLYYETDTHWNPLGAYYSFEQIFEKIQNFFPNVDFPKIEYKANFSYSKASGDLLSMLGIKRVKSSQIAMVPVNAVDSDYYDLRQISDEPGAALIATGKNKSLPTAMVFRDSFCIFLTQFLSPLFSRTEYYWRWFTEEDKALVLQNKPDLIIFESVERYAEAAFSGFSTKK